MAFFVGGQLLLAAAVVPAFRGARDRAPRRAIARRFGWGTLAAIAVLVATGVPLASNENRWDDSVLHAKLALVALVAVLVGLHVRFPERRELDAAVFVVSLAVVWLGVSLAHH
jgi:uncharacterized membrane protein